MDPWTLSSPVVQALLFRVSFQICLAFGGKTMIGVMVTREED